MNTTFFYILDYTATVYLDDTIIYYNDLTLKPSCNSFCYCVTTIKGSSKDM